MEKNIHHLVCHAKVNPTQSVGLMAMLFYDCDRRRHLGNFLNDFFFVIVWRGAFTDDTGFPRISLRKEQHSKGARGGEDGGFIKQKSLSLSCNLSLLVFPHGFADKWPFLLQQKPGRVLAFSIIYLSTHSFLPSLFLSLLSPRFFTL